MPEASALSLPRPAGARAAGGAARLPARARLGGAGQVDGPGLRARHLGGVQHATHAEHAVQAGLAGWGMLASPAWEGCSERRALVGPAGRNRDACLPPAPFPHPFPPGLAPPQSENEGYMAQSQFVQLHRALWNRQHAALERCAAQRSGGRAQQRCCEGPCCRPGRVQGRVPLAGPASNTRFSTCRPQHPSPAPTSSPQHPSTPASRLPCCRNSPEAIEEAKALRIGARKTLRDIDATPEYVKGGTLHPHQLKASRGGGRNAVEHCLERVGWLKSGAGGLAVSWGRK